jgi:hypothetical protein
VVQDFDHARPWVRQPFDTDLSWALFSEYLMLPPPRRLQDLARQGRTLTTYQLETLAFEDGWAKRAYAWDQHLDQLRFQTVEQVVQEDARTRAERQGRVGKKLQRLAELVTDQNIALAEKAGGFDSGITLRDAIRAAAVGVRIERIALGDTTDKIETVGPDLSAFTVEELREIQRLQEKAGSNVK